MNKSIFSAILLGSLVSAQAAPPAPQSPAKHPLIANWSWALPGKQCTETLRYLANGTRASTSGEEVAKSRYEVTPVPSLLGFYRVIEIVTETNGKADCAGDVHEVSGEPVTRFIQLSPKKDQLIVCKEESLKACFGPLKRELK
ncbi:hypothetical protein RCH06_000792 [Polaromonas sp. CG_9.5]|uniref:hypothetical protein n=1 Tax=Polaromonas sp. CG_9.5 TaxID=3071705 RepID=UPI002DFDDE8A|nr:hypothetical protein [Polaromonas sp. CG_9.5]